MEDLADVIHEKTYKAPARRMRMSERHMMPGSKQKENASIKNLARRARPSAGKPQRRWGVREKTTDP